MYIPSCRKRILVFVVVFFIFIPLKTFAGITTSKHNLSKLGLYFTGGPAQYDPGVTHASTRFNQYNEVCVYCHTPHSGIGDAGAPLWNKSVTTSTFTTYPTTVAGTSQVTVINPQSRVCLTCHDGTLAVDSIVNAPGPGLTWTGAVAPQHRRMARTTADPESVGGDNSTACGGCHDGGGGISSIEAGFLGTNLTNDHPISIEYSAPNADTNTNPANLRQTTYTINTQTQWIARTNKATNPTISDVLVSGRVECVSCHDPHLTINLTFLRATSSGSKICLTCHDK